MCKNVVTAALMALALAVNARPACAQGDLSLGYAFTRLAAAGGRMNLPVGLGVEYAHPLVDRWKVLGTLGWSQRHDGSDVEALPFDATFRQLTAGGGARWDAPLDPGARVYVQAAAGVVRSAFRESADGLFAFDMSSIDFMIRPGVGFVSGLTGRVGVFGQLDYQAIWPHANSAMYPPGTVNALRAYAGMRFRLP